jgi:hypothetical protein
LLCSLTCQITCINIGEANLGEANITEINQRILARKPV